MALTKIEVQSLCIWAELPVSLLKGDVYHSLLSRIDLGGVDKEDIQRAYDNGGAKAVAALFQ